MSSEPCVVRARTSTTNTADSRQVVLEPFRIESLKDLKNVPQPYERFDRVLIFTGKAYKELFAGGPELLRENQFSEREWRSMVDTFRKRCRNQPELERVPEDTVLSGRADSWSQTERSVSSSARYRLRSGSPLVPGSVAASSSQPRPRTARRGIQLGPCVTQETLPPPLEPPRSDSQRTRSSSVAERPGSFVSWGGTTLLGYISRPPSRLTFRSGSGIDVEPPNFDSQDLGSPTWPQHLNPEKGAYAGEKSDPSTMQLTSLTAAGESVISDSKEGAVDDLTQSISRASVSVTEESSQYSSESDAEGGSLLTDDSEYSSPQSLPQTRQRRCAVVAR